jgi:hypothetical protein
VSLLDALTGARLTVVDEDQRVVFAWFGGHGVNVYDEDGTEVHYFTIGGADRVTPTVVRAAIERVRRSDGQ